MTQMPDIRVFFAIVFLLGVSAGVYFLVRGVERDRVKSSSPKADELGQPQVAPGIALRAPVAASILVVSGLLGYLLSYFPVVPIAYRISGVVMAGLASGWIAYRKVRRWAQVAAEHDTPDERYALQGHLARVIVPGDGIRDAQVEYMIDGRRVVLPARAINDAPLGAGMDVVIERLEEGIAYVESWAHVEDRI